MITTMTRFLEILKKKVGNIQYLIELSEKEKQFKKANDLNIKLATYEEILTIIENED